jgi:hypothetical protein
VPLPAAPTIGATSVLLYLRGVVHPDPAAPETTYRIELDCRVWTVRTAAGRVHVECGEPAAADAGLRTAPETLNALLDDPATLEDAVAGGRAAVDGDPAALRRLLSDAVPTVRPAAG